MMGHENGTAAGQMGREVSEPLLSHCPTPREMGQMGQHAEGSKDPPSVSHGTGQQTAVDAPEPTAVELAMRVLAGDRDPLERPCIACDGKADRWTLFCPPCWIQRRSRGRLLAFNPDSRVRAEARLAGALCSVHGTATAWTVNARGDAWCSLCFPPRGAA
jgi:hypothetical protein